MSAGSYDGTVKMTPIEYSVQVVAGINYAVRLAIVDDNNTTHHAVAIIYQPLPPNQDSLVVTQFRPATLNDPLV